MFTTYRTYSYLLGSLCIARLLPRLVISWMPSKKWRNKNRPYSESGVLKPIRMFSANPFLMAFLKIVIAYDYVLLDNPQLGFDVPFVARVYVAVEPSNILDFFELCLNDQAVRKKLQGMLQVRCVTVAPCHPSTQGFLTPEQLQMWREARAQYNAGGFAEDPVGLIEFIDYSCAEDLVNSVTSQLLIPAAMLDNARAREPFAGLSTVTGTQFNEPMSAATCLQYLNLYIRADERNQLYMRLKMTKQDIEILRAAGRNEILIRLEKMEREHLFGNIFMQNGRVIRYLFYLFLVFLLGYSFWVAAM
ncbi:uncharacterized protein EDB93DRAFT_250205 [Suillus bovinus]|uniref:uncharacterized protein n=1 Tax=Suillus bovinus TaxID=48563 RepID=UPI001B879FD2|nr:uncharacterized protein EDB93DRAFT_250205 [Suillus bovinus]KAG2152549.1 hypothetical protein EDB93DRAFT_250205 [Suillus bovinus]